VRITPEGVNYLPKSWKLLIKKRLENETHFDICWEVFIAVSHTEDNVASSRSHAGAKCDCTTRIG
ncbi:hypothetical protein, partial [Gemmata sp.]|uniref:hypothetical protein n=1 Tax=Gemmata sp. TaxID=1914242 RepID=UPI003F70588D